MSEVIVLGSGRCGSTLVSEIMGRNMSVLSLSEFFAWLPDGALSAGPLDGAEFWALLTTTDHWVSRLCRQGSRIPSEVRYPAVGRRFSVGALPAICVTTLPALDDDPDTLYDELGHLVVGWPRAPLRDHYLRLFDRLRRRFGRDVVVERSGASLARAAALRALFPRARFVLLHRDGMETAISMSRHPVFRLAARDARRARRSVPAGGTGADLPIESFGRLWSGMTCAGVRPLAGLPADRLMILSYEDLVEDPVGSVRRLASFVGTDAPGGWLAAEAARIHPPPLRAPALPDGDRDVLRRTCEPGVRALRRLRAGRALASA